MDGPPASVLDLGSGGGLPGLVLGICWPRARLVLLDANERRCRHLKGAIDKLGVGDHTEVACGRAEVLARDTRLRERFAVVTARSFGRPAVTAECGAPFLAVRGQLVVSEPPPGETGPDGDRWPESALGELSLAPGRVARINQFGYQVLEKVANSKERYPRPIGVPSRRPLF